MSTKREFEVGQLDEGFKVTNWYEVPAKANKEGECCGSIYNERDRKEYVSATKADVKAKFDKWLEGSNDLKSE